MRTFSSLAFASLLLGCSASVTPPAADAAPADAPADAAADTPDAAEAGMCCPMAQFPSCDCFATGQRDPVTGCMMICDARVTGQAMGPDGCPYWATGGSCLPFGDVGRE